MPFSELEKNTLGLETYYIYIAIGLGPAQATLILAISSTRARRAPTITEDIPAAASRPSTCSAPKVAIFITPKAAPEVTPIAAPKAT